MRIVIASNNRHKINEIKTYLHDLPIEFLSLLDFPHIPPPREDGITFEENAIKKARYVFKQTGIAALGDDSGLEVDALNSEPGVFSARYAGEPTDDEANNRKLIEKLKAVPLEKRTARFQCVLAICESRRSRDVAIPKIKARNANIRTFPGTCPGKIIFEPRGAKGFGYDPLFVPNGFDKTFAELDMEEKLKISHRARALNQLREYLINRL